MIRLGGREVGKISLGARAFGAVMRGLRVVWQAVRSCFGAGQWRSDKPWLNQEGWKNMNHQ